jgi:tetratricopeptide (TPR) repeat protein
VGDQTGALASFKRAAELDSKAHGARFGMASALLKDGRKDEALQLARKLQQDKPQSALGHIIEGDLLLSGKQPREALAAYRRSLVAERTSMGALREYQTLVQMGENEQSTSALKASVAASPDDITLRSYAGQQALELKQWKVAVEHYERVIKLNATNPEAQNNLAWALHMQKDPKAETHARIAFQIAPLSGPIADTLGVILLAKGQVEPALELLRQAVMLAPKNEDIRLHLLQALQQKGKQEELQTQADQWVKDFPGSARMQEVQALLKRTPGG